MDNDERLSQYRVTATVEVQTQEILLASHASDAADSHRMAIDQIAEELGIDVEKIELLEIDELGKADNPTKIDGKHRSTSHNTSRLLTE